MTRSDRSKRSDLSPETNPVPRPQIWVDGHQRPRFNVRAFAAVSLAIARRDLAPEIADAVLRLDQFGHSVARGERRFPVAWAGRAARVVPGHQRVGGWILGLAALFQGAHDLLSPIPEPALAYPNLGPTPHPPKAPLAKIAAIVPRHPRSEPTLHAIRSAIQASPHDFGHETPPPRQTVRAPGPDPVAAVPLTRRAKAAMGALACRVLLGVLVAFALPAGMLRALLFHLNGGDLVDWS